MDKHGFQLSLKELTQNAKMLAEPLNNHDLFNEEFSQLCKEMGQQESEENYDILSMFTNMMQNLLSKEIFYPSIKELSSKVSSDSPYLPPFFHSFFNFNLF